MLALVGLADLANNRGLGTLGKQHRNLGELPCLGVLPQDTQSSQTPQIGPSRGKSRQVACHLPDEAFGSPGGSRSPVVPLARQEAFFNEKG